MYDIERKWEMVTLTYLLRCGLSRFTLWTRKGSRRQAISQIVQSFLLHTFLIHNVRNRCHWFSFLFRYHKQIQVSCVWFMQCWAIKEWINCYQTVYTYIYIHNLSVMRKSSFVTRHLWNWAIDRFFPCAFVWKHFM